VSGSGGEKKGRGSRTGTVKGGGEKPNKGYSQKPKKKKWELGGDRKNHSKKHFKTEKKKRKDPATLFPTWGMGLKAVVGEEKRHHKTKLKLGVANGGKKKKGGKRQWER